MKRCIGCGGTLQDEDKNRPFYTPKSVEGDAPLYCMRCFRMRHYGEVMPSYIDHTDYPALLDAVDANAAIAKVIDVFDIEGSIIPAITKFTRSNDLHIIANKRDLLPKQANDKKIKQRINNILMAYGLSPRSVHLISAAKRHGIDELIDHLESLDNDIYVVGASNTGKSTLINAMISAGAQSRETPITTFNVPGTTQDFIRIPFESHTLYDTPGVIIKNHYYNLLDAEAIAQAHPKKEIKPTTYQLSPNQTMFIGALARIDFISGLPSGFTFYVSPDVTLHRTKLLSADEVMDAHAGEFLKPALSEESRWWVHQYSIETDKKIDIVLSGIGFVSVSGRGVMRVHTPKAITPYKREALIG